MPPLMQGQYLKRFLIFNMERNNIYNCDCIDEYNGMLTLDEKYVDCIICDLPYFKVVKDDFDNQWKTEEEYLEWIDELIAQYDYILKPGGNIFLFTSRQLNRKICNILDKYGFEEKRIIIWSRKRGFNNTRGHALASGYEPIAYYTKPGGEPTFNNIKIKPDTNRKEYTDGILKDGVCLSDVWTDIPALPHNSKEKTEHPTQKPVKLIERLIEIGTNEGDLVFDSCIGSGTTAVACINTNRDFIGFEKDANYYQIAKLRMDEAMKNKESELW